MRVIRYSFFILLFLCAAAPLHAAEPADQSRSLRTYDTLNREERAELERLEQIYLNGVRNEGVAMVTAFFDTHTVIQTFTPQARIIRQRKRSQLNDVVRYLCSLRLEQEFITFYADRLRDDAVDYALDGMLKKSRSLKR
ncbi:hypothetical protein LJC23_04645 [Desulfovibrio sp. OttesenSCG-928-I05]|nr:hypothetical protein [Desulfovibrio sp. OttesenSCG-928-I05]